MNPAPRLAAIIVAAGRGERMGAAVPKAFLPLAGRPLFLHSLATFARLPDTSELIVVVGADRVDEVRREVRREVDRAVTVVAGGAERQDSVACGLAAVAGAELVAVHDAARPFIRREHIAACAAAAAESGAAIVAVPAHDTVKIADADRFVTATPARASVWQAQTPQIFRTALLRRAYAAAAASAFLGTDDASLVERLGERVRLVPGAVANRKLTTPDDLAWAEWRLRQERS